MSVQLEILDGSPWWYLSEDVWVVPGSDPYGSRRAPRPGEKSFLWARVTNVGDTAVRDGTVFFWWANPSTAMTFGDLVPVGRSQVSLQPGESREVLCLSQWNPILVNGGHECIIVLAFSPSEPLPMPNSTDPLQVVADHRLAQFNLTLEEVSPGNFMAWPFIIRNPFLDREVRTSVRLRRTPLTEMLHEEPPPGWPRKDLSGSVHAGLFQGERFEGPGVERPIAGSPWEGPHPGELPPELELVLAPGEQWASTLVLAVPDDAEPGNGAAFLIEQDDGDTLLGGCGVVFIVGD